MVAAASDSDASNFEPSPLKPTKSSKKSTSIPSQISKKPKKSAVQPKATQELEETNRGAAAHRHPSSSRAIVGTKVSGLPEFAKIGWTNRFLPTLYDAFYANEKPFDNFLKDSPEFLKIVQKVVSTVYPDIHHKIRGGDLLLKTVCFYCEAMSLQLNVVYSGQ
jgi:hypothetical protein